MCNIEKCGVPCKTSAFINWKWVFYSYNGTEHCCPIETRKYNTVKKIQQNLIKLLKFQKPSKCTKAIFPLTCGVYVLIGGQPFAPQFKAKWMRGSASGRATWWATRGMTGNMQQLVIPYETVKSVKYSAVVWLNVWILVAWGLFWRTVYEAVQHLFCSLSEHRSQCPAMWTPLLQSGNSHSWRTAKKHRHNLFMLLFYGMHTCNLYISGWKRFIYRQCSIARRHYRDFMQN